LLAIRAGPANGCSQAAGHGCIIPSIDDSCGLRVSMTDEVFSMPRCSRN
jgi:hypothetical protein